MTTSCTAPPSDDLAPADPHDWVDAAPFRSHLLHLCHAHALGWRAMAALGGVPTTLAARLVGVAGRPLRRLPRDIAQRLLALDDSTVAALLARRPAREDVLADLAALARAGYGVDEVIRRTGLRSEHARLLHGGVVTSLERRDALLIRALRDQVGDDPVE